MGISVEGCKVVLEQDGSEIDEDELLQAFADRTLIILGQGENQTPPSSQPSVVSAEPDNPVTNGETGTALFTHSTRIPCCRPSNQKE